MSEYKSDSDLLMAYLDGELSPEETSRLFFTAAQSPELQEALRQYMAMRSAIAVRPNFVPGSLRESVLKKTIGRKYKYSFFPMLKQKLGIAIPSVLALTVGASLIAMWQFDQIFGSDAVAAQVSEKNLLYQEPLIFDNATSQHSDEPTALGENLNSLSNPSQTDHVVKQGINIRKTSTVVAHKNSEAVNLGMGKANIPVNATVENAGNRNVSELPVIAPTSLFPSDFGNQRFAARNPIIASGISTTPFFVENAAGSLPIEVSFRGFSAYSFVKTSGLNPQLPAYNNMALSVMARLDNQYAVGAEVGHESFQQIFREKSSDTLYRYEQIVSTPWIGLTGRYLFPAISSLGDVEPFASAVLGGTSLGPLGRVGLGARYEMGRMSMMVGIEATAMLYSYQSQLHVTPKIGFSYGLSVRL